MAKKAKKKKGERPTLLTRMFGFFAWLTGVIVSLTIGVAMIHKNLSLEPYLVVGITQFFGWIVVVTTLLGVLLAIAKQFE